MGLSNVDAWFSSIGIPGFLAYVVAMLELVGGIMLNCGIVYSLCIGIVCSHADRCNFNNEAFGRTSGRWTNARL
jgi:hypothetical protein